jgi:hypothetical protein
MSGHNANCASRLRAGLLEEAGSPADPPPFLLQAIAAEIIRCCGHRPLKGCRLARGWTVETALAAFHAMCQEEALGARGLTARSWLEWEAGEHPNADYQDLLCRLFRADPVSLGFSHAYGDSAAEPGPDRVDGGEMSPGAADLVNRAARESIAHVATAELSDAGPTLLDLFETEVTRLARAYLHEASLPVFTQLTRMRSDACELLAGRLSPSQRARMMLVMGQVCGLLANASLDLGSTGAAAAQARAAWTYAMTIRHHGLTAWIRGLQAMIAYWSQDQNAAIAFARDGQRFASSGTASTRLHAIEALACAAVSARRDALAALDAAERCQRFGKVTDEIHDVIGGEFGFAPAKRSYLAGSTYVCLGRPRQAIACAETAIRLYMDGPATERSYGNEALARVDLVNGYVMADNLEAACQSAAVIFELPREQRIDGLSRRLHYVGLLLRGQRYQRMPQALELVERINDFNTRQNIVSDGGSLTRRPIW